MVDADTLADKEQELIALLGEYVPSLDFSPGTVLHSLLVKPFTVLLAEQDADVAQMVANMSLSGLLTQTTPDDAAVDALLSNYGITRKQGTTATGTLVIKYNTTAGVLVTTSTLFICGAVTLRPVKAVIGVVSSAQVRETTVNSYRMLTDDGQGNYLLDVPVITTAAISTALTAGMTCSMTPADSRVTGVVTGSTFVGGAAAEGNSSLLSRAAVGVGARAPVSRDGIQAWLTSLGEGVTVSDVAVAGAGDSLMLRDRDITGVVSTGGCIDVYVRTNPLPTMTTLTITGTLNAVTNRYEFDIPSADCPGAYGVVAVVGGAYALTDVVLTPGFMAGDEGYPRVNAAADARYSAYQTLAASVKAPFTDSTVDFRVTVLYMPGIDTLQALVQDPAYRNPAVSMLIKAAVPVLVSANVVILYRPGTTIPSVEDLQSAIADAVNQRVMRTEAALNSSELVTAIQTAGVPGMFVRSPLVLTGSVYMPDGRTLHSFTSDRLDLPDAEGVELSNTIYCCFPGNVSITFQETAG